MLLASLRVEPGIFGPPAAENRLGSHVVKLLDVRRRAQDPRYAASLPVAILAPLWLILPTVAITLIRREASRSDEQPTSLLSLVASRAPPFTLAFA